MNLSFVDRFGSIGMPGFITLGEEGPLPISPYCYNARFRDLRQCDKMKVNRHMIPILENSALICRNTFNTQILSAVS